ncbi:MAG TPA: IPT/TIG domain-containing protein [Vicinamibacterales bacterium]
MLESLHCLIQRRTYLVLLAAFSLGASACGGKSPTTPTPPSTNLTLTSIAPPQGSTTGGNNLTINGANFTSDATVIIGGVVATNVAVQSPTMLTAVLGARASAGVADVVVTSGGRTATLSKAFTFVAPSGTNKPPVVTTIQSVGSRPKQPSGFADQDETVTLIATVTDAETSASSLVYAWSGLGIFSAPQPITVWRLPATVSPVPSTVTATLTVTENYVEGSITHRNITTAPFAMSVHDSQKEILDEGTDFLTLFSQSNIPTSQVLHNFSATCGGRDAEAVDTDRARSTYVQNFSKFRISSIPPVTFNFFGRCAFRLRPGDACAAYNVHWEITYIKADDVHYVGEPEITDGIDYVTAVLENNQWKLCSSDFSGVSTNPKTGAKRFVERRLH